MSTFRLGHAVPCTMIRLFKQLSIQVVFALSLLLSSTAHAEDILLNLGDLDGGIFYSYANVVNADGSVVVGESYSGNGYEAFRWTEGTGMVGLGDLAGGVFDSYAYSVNADGSVVVGYGSSGNGTEAFRWTEGTGMQSVEDWLAAAGISMGSFSILSVARGVNADGSVVVGVGNSVNGSEAFLASISGLVGLTDLGHSINQSYATSNQMAGLNSLILNGAHHRPLAEMAVGSGSNCAWVVGDLSSHSRQADGSSHLSEVGVCHDFKPQNLRIGVGIGASQSNLRLANDGRARLSGKHVLAEVDWQSPHHPILVSVLGTYGQWDADLTRGYAVTGTKRSKGETDVDAYSIRARVDWQDAFHVGPVGVSPRLAYTIMHTEIDGYQEDGGSAPANFKDQTHMAKEMRYGLTGKYKLTDKTTLLGHAEGVHRFDTHAARIKANINALGYHIGVNQEGSAVSQNWGRLGGEVDYQLTTDSRISFSTFVASAGEDADVSGSLSWQVAF